MRLINAKKLLFNYISTFRFWEGKFNNSPNKFAQDAGIGDAIIYLSYLQNYSKYCGDIHFYLPDTYIKLLSSSASSRVKLLALTGDVLGRDTVNLSPHRLIGGFSFLLRKTSCRYFLRAVLRVFGIYIYNEYNHADFAFRFLLNHRRFADSNFSGIAGRVVICPETSSVSKSLTLDELHYLINKLSSNPRCTEICVVSRMTAGLPEGAKLIWSEDLHGYTQYGFDWAFCCDTALLHFFYFSDVATVLLSKDRQHKTFTPPVISMKFDFSVR